MTLALQPAKRWTAQLLRRVPGSSWSRLHTVTSNGAGRVTLDGLRPGTYQVRGSVPGMKVLTARFVWRTRTVVRAAARDDSVRIRFAPCWTEQPAWRVKLQQRRHGRWLTVRRVMTTGAAAIHRLDVDGLRAGRYRALTPARYGCDADTSRTLRVRD